MPGQKARWWRWVRTQVSRLIVQSWVQPYLTPPHSAATLRLSSSCCLSAAHRTRAKPSPWQATLRPSPLLFPCSPERPPHFQPLCSQPAMPTFPTHCCPSPLSSQGDAFTPLMLYHHLVSASAISFTQNAFLPSAYLIPAHSVKPVHVPLLSGKLLSPHWPQ